MKRPKAIILIAVWLFLVLMLIWNGVNRLLGISAGSLTPENYQPWYLAVMTMGFVLVIWEVTSFIALLPTARWIAVCVFSYWSIVRLWNAVFAIWFLDALPARFFVSTTVTIAISVACVWYLTRRKFRDFCVEYVRVRRQEKYSRDMRKAAEKKLRNELGKR